MDPIYTLKGSYRNFGASQAEKTLKNMWTNYFIKKREVEGIRPVILSSWKRSLKHRVTPFANQALVCDLTTLIKVQQENKNILTLIRPFMDDLFDMVKGTDSLIAFANKDGIVLDLCGDSEIAMNAASINFTVGADMSEESIGTNAIGTALVTEKAIQIIGAEHYCAIWHSSHCSSAPIIDPFTNELIGAITLIGYIPTANPHSLGLVKTAADTIVKLMEQQGIMKETYMMNNYFNAAIDSISDGILIVNRFGEIIQANKMASHLLKLPMNVGKCRLRDIEHLHPFSMYLSESIQGNEVIFQEEIGMPHDEKHKLIFTMRGINDGNEHIGSIIILKKKVNKETNKLKAKYVFSSLIGEAPLFKQAIKRAQKAACTDKSIVITGESGTGKELFAQAIHNESMRQSKPFLAINCAAIPKDLIASELFGYVEGAFTNAARGGRKGKFEAANGGTIFLDEIGDMPLELQAHLLRVLEEKEITPVGSHLSNPIDVRIIAATNKDLFQLVKENKFRLDLFYRLNIISLQIPPLNKRKQDIELFISHFLPTKKVSNGVLTYFFEYDWPGNLREFKNVMEQIEIFCEESIVTEEHLPSYIRSSIQIENNDLNLYQSLANETKKDTLIFTLKNSGSVSQAAKKLGVSASTLYRWASEYQLNVKDYIQST
ncbi:sigma-54-dependent Fis family transcriptional regulator [Neobacillus sp. MM2021_6]|uniref:sigma-54-dependent Fis family transcriptional regulator n=1 Tax=Bacillaceae TaxID=186817 RepID=UPI001409F1F4|nr:MULTISPECIES: sigma-54-dependent Fis family transcriptional regulator [Bacillaceae]MBO0962325.1 sigma-54-dependent Fis family transcriptional regulator [Neobacillus sp. MM2021_6]NHC20806.1 sigma-54-dependent Fis family transcriptional regulator [Bacillus sp. MM2020_4]